jgi:hypothetical protein
MVTDPVTPIMSNKLAIGGVVTGSDPGELREVPDGQLGRV